MRKSPWPLFSQQLDLVFMQWEGIYQDLSARWLRWAMVTGVLLPIPQEASSRSSSALALEALLARYRERFGDIPQ